MRYRYVLFVIFVVVLLPKTNLFAQELNAGFVEGLWYSQEELFADTPVRIYAALRNNTGGDLTGTVRFYVGEERIDRKSVSALDGRIIETWADWTPTYGEHTLSVTLSNITLHSVGNPEEDIEITTSLAEDNIFVDYDTDKDGIGNSKDTDDDNDGISDVEEMARGTDPLVENVVEAAEEETDDVIDEESSQSDSSSSSQSSTLQGLEQYLGDNRLRNGLTSITETITETKKAIDTYRDERNQKRNSTEATVSSKTASSTFGEDADSFGTIQRTTSNTAKKSIWNSFVGMVKGLFGAITTFTLFAFSEILGHPILVQLLLLFGILFAVFKLAKKLGSRGGY